MNWSMTTSTQSLWSTMDAQRKRSTLHRLSVVCPTNDNHEGPVPPGAGRERFASTRCTTFLSMSTPNVCEMMRAIRGHPNRGLRDLSFDDGADERLARPLWARLLRSRA